jgi:protein-S-isoprenylcysteine O-methyltransferase Ste14
MDAARYYVALVALITMPPAFLWWFLIHPFVKTWLRLGTATTFTVVLALSILFGWAIYQVRRPLLSTEFGFSVPLAVLALFSYLVAVAIELACRRHLKIKILVGLPEVSTDGGRLLTAGIYGRIRHPRYVSVFFGLVAVALFTNYLAMYVYALAALPTARLLVVFEERELRDRFGAEFDAYCRRVPCFVPRMRQS